MLGKLTTYATLGRQPIDSQVELRASIGYLINTDNIIEVVDETTYRTVRYKFNIYDDRIPELFMLVSDSRATIVTLSDATPASNKIALSVYEEAESFNQCASITPTTWYFNVADIVWGESDSTNTYTRLWVASGGHHVTPYIVGYNVDEIVDVADTGTTTSSTTSTSTTSTSTTSTSTSSTSTTSTSSTSTSSTSSTSTSSTSTTSTTTIA